MTLPDQAQEGARDTIERMGKELVIAVDGPAVSLKTVDAYAFFTMAAAFVAAVMDAAGGNKAAFRLHPSAIREGSACAVFAVESVNDAGPATASAAAVAVREQAEIWCPKSQLVRDFQAAVLDLGPANEVYLVVDGNRLAVTRPTPEPERLFAAGVEEWRAKVVGVHCGEQRGRVSLHIEGRVEDFPCDREVAKCAGKMLDEIVAVEVRLVRFDDHRRHYGIASGELLTIAKVDRTVSAHEALKRWATPSRPTRKAKAKTGVSQGT